jgi:hypothetical protein
MNYKVELKNGMTFVCNNISDVLYDSQKYAITIGEVVTFIAVSDVLWIDPTFASAEVTIHRNQANRIATIVAVWNDKMLVRYQMPKGKVFHNYLFPNNTYKSVKFQNN